MKTVSVVIPLYNEELLVGELVSRLQKATQNLSYQFEFVLVDDGSRDSTVPRLLELQRMEPRLNIIKLSRNWGHQNAYNAGIDEARGDAVILMDGDLEDPPELIPAFLEKWEEGNEVVYGVRKSRQGSWFDKFLTNVFYKMLRFFSKVDVEHQAGMFSLVDRAVIYHLRHCHERNKYYVGLRAFLGYRQTGLPYDRDKRFAGKPKQDFYRLLQYALNAYFSFSFLPIRILTCSGLVLLLLILMAGIFLIAGRLFDIPIAFFQSVRTVPGWTTLVLLALFLIAMQIVFIGVLGEYVARIFDEVRNRPYYIVENIYRAADNREAVPLVKAQSVKQQR